MNSKERFRGGVGVSLFGTDGTQNRLGVTGAARADLFIGGVLGMTAGVADSGGIDAIAELPEFSFRAPEATETEYGFLQTLRISPLQVAGAPHITKPLAAPPVTAPQP